MINLESRLNIKNVLSNFYADSGVERVGFILPGNSIVEVVNSCEKPDEGFMVKPEDTIEYVENQGAVATWHTHPGSPSNLSGEDYIMFKNWSDLTHFIVGKDGVRCFYYDHSKKAVIEALDE